MNIVQDIAAVRALEEAQQGVFSTTDLEIALGDRHKAGFVRRVNALLEGGVLRRFVRGWYVCEDFDLPTLSQRLAPESCVSFANALARHLLVGPRPAYQVMATKVGKSRVYRAHGFEIVHLSIARDLAFGFQVQDGVRWAKPEKAFLDTLYFHLRGRSFPFDPFSDIDSSRLDEERLLRYLRRYKNPKFIAFVEGVLR